MILLNVWMAPIGAWTTYVLYGYMLTNGLINQVIYVIYMIAVPTAGPLVFILFYLNDELYRK